MNVPKVTRITIQIKVPGARPREFYPYVVDARILVKDIFALHRPVTVPVGSMEPKQEGKDWTLTHIPTGQRVLHGILTIKQAMSIVKDLTNKGIDWSFTDIQTVDETLRKRAKEVVQAIKGVYGLPEY